MRDKGKRLWKRIIAILLVFSIVLADSNIWSITAVATNTQESVDEATVEELGESGDSEDESQEQIPQEPTIEEENVSYNISAVVNVGNRKIRVTNAEIVIKEISTGNQIVGQMSNGVVRVVLVVGKEYSVSVSGYGISGPSVHHGFVASNPVQGGNTLEIEVPIDSLDISFKDNLVEVENQSEFDLKTLNIWNLDYTWESANPEIASVDVNGIVTGKAIGTTTITKTETTTRRTAEISVVVTPEIADREIEAVISGTTVSLQEVFFVVTDDEGTVVPSTNDAKTKFNLTEGETYSYQIKDVQDENAQQIKGIESGSLTGTFTVKSGQKKISLNVDVVYPVYEVKLSSNQDIKLSSNDIKTTTKIKKGATVVVDSTNEENIFQNWNSQGKAGWTYQVNDLAASDDMYKEFREVTCDEPLVIKTLYKGQVVKTYTIGTFEDYIVSVKYGKTILSDVDYTFKEKDYSGQFTQSIELENLQAETEYEISLKREKGGFVENNTQIIKPSLFSDTIVVDVPADKMSKPSVSCLNTELEGYSGGEISLKNESGESILFVEGDYYTDDSFKWEWRFVKESNGNYDLENSVPVDDKIDLKDVSAGQYALIYTCSDLMSNAIPVTVKKLPVDFDWGKWTGMTKNYDGTKEFTIKIPMSDDAVLISEKENYNIGEDDFLVIKGTVDSADIGDYDTINVTSVDTEGTQDKYDVEDLRKKLEDTEVKDLVDDDEQAAGKLKIRKAQVFVEKIDSKLSLYIVTQCVDGNASKGAVDFVNVLENKDALKDDLFEAMGKATIIDATTCTFANVVYKATVGQNETHLQLDTSNVIFYFSDENLGATENRIELKYDTVAESKPLENFYANIKFTQVRDDAATEEVETVTLTHKSWCNENAITAQLLELQGGELDTVAFSALGETSLNQLEWRNHINPDNLSRTITINQLGKGSEKLYAVFYTKSSDNGIGIDGSYNKSSPAGIVRVISEEDADVSKDYPVTVDINGEPWTIITLFYDRTTGEVSFDDDNLNRGQNWNIERKNIDKKEVAFTVENTGLDISSVEYAILDVAEIFGDDKTINVGDLGDVEFKDSLPVTKDGKYTIPLTKDGDYVVAVKVTNEAYRTRTYYSHAFMCDSVVPVVDISFFDNDKDVTALIKKGNYCPSTDNIVMNVKVSERHLENLVVNVTATDAKGEVILEKKYEEKDGIKNLRKDNINKSEFEFEYPYKENGNYKLTILATDTAENQGVTKEDFAAGVSGNIPTYVFTIDNEAPTGEIAIEGELKTIKKLADGKIKLEKETIKLIATCWDELIDYAKSRIYSKSEIKYILSSSDRISDTEAYYYVYYASESDQNTWLTQEDLDKLDEEEWKKCKSGDTHSVPKDKSAAIYQKVKDAAGNVTYINVDGIMTDSLEPKASIIPSKPNKNGFYNGDIPITIKAEDVPAEGAIVASGIQYIGYEIESGDKKENIKVYDNTNKRKEIEWIFEKDGFSIDANKYNSNDVKVSLVAIDYAGNEYKEPYNYKIDATKPVISIDFNDTEGAEFYNQERTATVTITERNLDTKNDVEMVIKSKHGSKAEIGKWIPKGGVGESDAATHTCTVTFRADDDYEFYVDCVDKAGNEAVDADGNDIDPKDAHVFTVDKTPPNISVSYSGGEVEEDGYYNSAVTATITIEEHNFDASKADITVNGPDGTRIGASSFSDNGDTHTASVVFNQDGAYSLDVAVTDEAGNEAQSYSGNTFNVDLKEPEIVISNVKDKSANKDEVKPIITCTDENYDKDKVTITVTGANSGNIDLSKLSMEKKAVANGEEFYLTFPKEEMMDDIYTLTAKMYDKADNETEESIQFSVNRYGSVYTLGTETGEWLTNGVCSYIQEGKPVVIIETNVDEIVERNISYTAGTISAETIAVNEYSECSSDEKTNGTYFQSKKISSGNDWYQYQYTIQKDNFTKEGHYSIQIDSKDKAGNHASNVSNKHSDSNLEILFAVDQTAPSAVVSGTENGGIYQEEKRVVMLDVQDNLALSDVTVYLNGDTYATYDAKALSELSDGLIPVEVKESFTTQTIQLMARDMAGNVLGENVNGTYDKTFEDFNLIVTQNIVVQMLYKYWWYIAIGVGALTGVILLIIFKRKKR